jgi:hypothetical protein
METITLKEWNEASTEQRSVWLAAGVLVRSEDLEALNAQAFA